MAISTLFERAYAALGKNRALDLTVGKPLPLLLRFSVPFFVCFLVTQTYVIADRIVIGRCCGPDALAALACLGGLQFLLFGFLNGHTTGLTVITAQRVGAKDPEGVRRSIATALVAGTAGALAVTAFAVPLLPSMMRLLRVPENIFGDAWLYMVILLWSAVPAALNSLIANILRALGDSVTPMIILVLSALLNIVLNIFFVMALDMGVAGVAVATAVSNVASAAVSWFIGVRRYEAMRLHRADFRIDWGFMWRHLKISLPMGLQFSITAIGSLVNQAACNALGSDAVATIGVTLSSEFFFFAPINAIGGAMPAYAAQNIGARRVDRIREGTWAIMVVMSLYSLAVGVAFWLIETPIAVCFIKNPDAAVIRDIALYLRTASFFTIPLTAINVYRNVLQGMGHAIVPFIGGVLELIARASLSFPLMHRCGFRGICYVNPIAWLVAAVWLVAMYPVLVKRDAAKIDGNAPQVRV